MKSTFKIIAIILLVIMAVLGIMYVLDWVGGPEMKDIVLKVLEVGGILTVLSVAVALVTGKEKSN